MSVEALAGVAAFKTIREGWMEKRGGVRRNWKKRYFLLTDSAISYYTKDPRPPSSGEFKGRVSLGDIQCVVAADETEKRKNVTLVVTEARTYEFQAPTSEERQAWIMAININLPNSAMQRKNSTKTLLAERRAGALKRRSVIGKIGAAMPNIGRKTSSTSVGGGAGGAEHAGLLDDDDDGDGSGNAGGSSFDDFRRASLKKLQEKESASKKAAVGGDLQGEYDVNGGVRDGADFGLSGDDFGEAPPPPPRTASFKRANPAPTPIVESEYIAPGGGTTGSFKVAPAVVEVESEYIAPGGGTTGSIKVASKPAPVEVESEYVAPGGAIVRAPAAEAVVSLPPPAVDTKEIQLTLGLNDEDVLFYIALWEYVDANQVNRIAGRVALGFLQSSNLSNKQLRDIWAASDTKQPGGSLTRDEFFVACKLVALKQQGKPAQVSNLTIEVGPPVFSQFGDDEEEGDDEMF